MSFKRDGDDHSWLNLLQKRRVAELLSFDIPEDEALLTSNGRYCCLVCSYKPVFDTVNVLATHRSGKKHQLHYEKFAKEKDNLNALKLSRQHDEYIKQGKITSRELLDDGTTNKISLGSAPYDPRVKKRKLNEQKSRIFLSGQNGKYEAGEIKTSKYDKHINLNVPHATKEESLPGHSKFDSNCSASSISDKESNLHKTSKEKDVNTISYNLPVQSKNDISKNDILNTISDYKKQQAFENRMMAFKIKPYVSKRKCSDEIVSEKDVQQDIEKCSSIDPDKKPTNEKQFITSFMSQESHQNSHRKFNIAHKNTNNSTNINDVSFINVPTKPAGSSKATVQEGSFERNKTNELQTAQNQLKRSSLFSQDKTDMTSKQKTKENKMAKNKLSECQMKKAQTYLNAIGSGWKRDFRTGTWVKDEDAEFDSDDEPPDIE